VCTYLIIYCIFVFLLFQTGGTGGGSNANIIADSTQNQPPYPLTTMIPGQQLGSDQQSDQQSDPGKSQKHPYPQPYQQQYHQHYHPQQHPYHFPGERTIPPQQQEYPGNPGAYTTGVPQGHPYGNGGDEASSTRTYRLAVCEYSIRILRIVRAKPRRRRVIRTRRNRPQIMQQKGTPSQFITFIVFN
jgi:hypothetical protein